ncbi:ComEC/Rec2 family competence protein [Candidatus Saccharibacteria bacterium]|nr:ComEC/Rec2 family competence protein [Candidatus Saccharibacteria bacterium]
MLKKMIRQVLPAKVFLAFLGGIVAGTVLSVALSMNFFTSVYWVIFAGISLIFSIIKPNYLTVSLALIAGITLGSFRVSSELSSKAVFEQLVGKNVVLSGEVQGDPDFDGSSSNLRLKVSEAEFSGTIFVSGFIDSRVERGDRIEISGKLSEGFGSFSGAIYRGEITRLEKPMPGSLLLKFRNGFAEQVRKNLGEENSREASLGLAYLLGMRNGLDEETLEILRLVGLTHIVVASGTHLGIIVEFFRKSFGKVSRFAGLFFSLIFILLFGELVGWTASIMRAALVSGLTLLAGYSGRKLGAGRVILFAMATTLLVNPMFLVDLGWLLSFGSFIGIMILNPRLTRFFYGEKKPGKIAEIILTTISATLMCAPILLFFFGSLSLISIVANLLILPTIPYAMLGTLLTGAIGFIPGVGFLTNLLLKYHLFVMEFFSKQTSFLVQIPSGKTEVFLAYIVILLPFIFGDFIRASIKRKKRIKFEKNFAKNIRLTIT